MNVNLLDIGAMLLTVNKDHQNKVKLNKLFFGVRSLQWIKLVWMIHSWIKI